MKQADYVASRLTGGAIASDWHNALKLGFDVRALRYPEWLTGGEIGKIARGRLPRVVRPGEPIGPVSDKLVAKCVRPPAQDSVEATARPKDASALKVRFGQRLPRRWRHDRLDRRFPCKRRRLRR